MKCPSWLPETYIFGESSTNLTFIFIHNFLWAHHHQLIFLIKKIRLSDGCLGWNMIGDRNTESGTCAC